MDWKGGICTSSEAPMLPLFDLLHRCDHMIPSCSRAFLPVESVSFRIHEPRAPLSEAPCAFALVVIQLNSVIVLLCS